MSFDDATSGVGVNQSGKSGGDASGHAAASGYACGGSAGASGTGSSVGTGVGLASGGDAAAAAGATGAAAGDATDNTSIGSINVNAQVYNHIMVLRWAIFWHGSSGVSVIQFCVHFKDGVSFSRTIEQIMEDGMATRSDRLQQCQSVVIGNGNTMEDTVDKGGGL